MTQDNNEPTIPTRGSSNPDLENKWRNLARGLGTLIGVAGTFILWEHLRGNEEKRLGSYYASISEGILQGRTVLEDPENVQLQLPENRALTRLLANAAPTNKAMDLAGDIEVIGTRLIADAARDTGIPIHGLEDHLPGVIPEFVIAVRTFRFRGSTLFYYEEIDVRLAEETRTISALVGRRNALGLWNTPEQDRAVRILSGYDLGRQGIDEAGIGYSRQCLNRQEIIHN